MGDKELDPQRVLTEFDCPNCDANNPYDDGFKHGDEVRCYYCGCLYKVKVSESSGRVKYREV